MEQATPERGNGAGQECILVQVSRDEDIRNQIGKTRYFDLVDHSKVRSFRVPKHTCFILIKEMVAEELGIPFQFQRFWLWGRRQNCTYRPLRPLTVSEETQPVVTLLTNKSHEGKMVQLNLFLEDLRPVPPPHTIEGDILLFFKLYEPEKEALHYVGRLYVKSTRKPAEILLKLNEMAGYPLNTVTDLYEEVKFQPSLKVDPVAKETSFRALQIESGDIVCFQKSPSPETLAVSQYPTVDLFYAYVRSYQLTFQHATIDDCFSLSARFIAMKKELRESQNQCRKLEKLLNSRPIKPAG